MTRFEYEIGAEVAIAVAGEVIAQQRSANGDSYLVAYDTSDGRVKRWHTEAEIVQREAD